jgi:DNA-binding NarL/FixJ family response regulator
MAPWNPAPDGAIRMVIVDDHAGFRATARAVMEAEGFTVVGEAGDGASAVAEVLRIGPDVVLLDVELPDENGFAVAAELARQGSSALVVLTSSRDSTDFGKLVEESPVRGFIPKGELSGEGVRNLLG